LPVENNAPPLAEVLSLIFELVTVNVPSANAPPHLSPAELLLIMVLLRIIKFPPQEIAPTSETAVLPLNVDESIVKLPSQRIAPALSETVFWLKLEPVIVAVWQ